MNFSANTRKPGAYCTLINRYILIQFMRIGVLITFIYLTTSAMLLAATALGQSVATTQVTLNLQHETVESAIKKIEAQTTFHFYYRRLDIKDLKNLTLNAGKVSLAQALGLLLANTFITFRQIDDHILLERKTAQDYTINGRVIDQQRKPVPFANVALFKDKAAVQATQSDTAGNFHLTATGGGDFLIKISSVGMDTLTIAVTLAGQRIVTLPDLMLSASATQLRQVNVVSSRPMIEHLVDRTVVNVDALLSNTGSTVLDVLAKSPGVQVDENGGINLQGKGVKIYIDDRPTYLSGDDLTNYLRSLPSSNIDRLELMTTPPAKYDAAGNGGIINIRTKRIGDKGFNGNLNLAYVQGNYGRSNDGLNLNYRRDQFNVAFSLGYNHNNNYNDVDLNRYFDQSITGIAPGFLQQSFTRYMGNNYSGRLNIDFYATEKTTVGIGLNGLLNNSDDHTLSTSHLSTGSQLDSTIIADNLQHRYFKNGGINLNYRHAYDKKGTELTADLDYVAYQTQLNQDYTNNSYLPDGTLYYRDILTGNLPSHINIYAATTDYTHPFANGIQFSAGLKSSYIHTDNVADYFNTVDAVTSPDYNKTNHFIYRENINAGYVSARKDFKKFSIQAGLRYENTNANGHQLGNAQKPDSAFSRSYNAFFPTLFAQYRIDSASGQRLTFRYGRRIDRPGYASLNPFLSQIDKFTYNQGNPYLLPSFTDNFELDYDFFGITTGISYSYIHDGVDGLVQVINGYYYSTPGNLGNRYVVNFEAQWQKDLFSWFNFNLYSRVFYQRTTTNFYTGLLDTRGTEWVIEPILTFKPGRDWTVQADGHYQSGIPSAQFIDRPKKSINLALSRKLSASTTIRLVGNDVFHMLSNNWAIGYLAGTNAANYHSISDTRNVVLSLSYRFGKTINNLRKHEDTATRNEQGRVGN
ncbi:MAG: outer membrane beta-barrel protein [Bacteroidota bacterium]